MGIILAAFCVISAGALAWVYLFTQPRIELYAKTSFENSLKNVLPAAASFKEVDIRGRTAYEGLKDGKTVGWAFKTAPQGYSDKIEMLTGVDIGGRVRGVKILAHRETPGLGANIVKPEFLGQFTGKTSADPLEPKSDIDAITGATISSRAVSRGVRGSLELLKP